MSTYLFSTRGFDGRERSSVCVCTLKRFVAFCARTTRCARNVSLPGRHSLTLGQYTTLPFFITFYSARVPRDSSLLCDRTITRPGIYIRFASSSSVRCFVNTREHHHQQRSRTRKKNLLFFLLLLVQANNAFFFLTSYSKSFRIPRAFSCSFAARATLSR